MYTILIVDDEKIERNGIKFLLKKQAEPFEIYEDQTAKQHSSSFVQCAIRGKR